MLSIIVAAGKNGEIGVNNELLWSMPADLRYFKEKTKGKLCIQGKNTYDSIVSQLGKPLPNRTNIIISRDKKFEPHPSCYVYDSISAVLDEYKNHSGKDDEVMIIGGSSVYSQFLPFADCIYLTRIHHTFPNADSYFPELDDSWQLISNVHNEADEKNPHPYSFQVFERI